MHRSYCEVRSSRATSRWASAGSGVQDLNPVPADKGRFLLWGGIQGVGEGGGKVVGRWGVWGVLVGEEKA